MLTPYYEDGTVTIYHGDCREILPALTEPVEALISDPPYGLNIGYGRPALGLRTIQGDGDTKLIEWISREATRLMGHMGWVVIFCGYSQVGEVQRAAHNGGLNVKTVIVWDKAMPSIGMGIRNQHEMAVLARKGSPPETWTGGNVWTFTRTTGRPDHPHQKPIKLMGRIVEHYSPAGGVVLDPFMGSGSTLRAAKDRGRRAIGIEMDERYCHLAAERLAQDVLDFGKAA